MKKPRFINMTPEEFRAYSPSGPEDVDYYEAEVRFRDWCDDQDPKLDPQDEEARESYAEIQRESSWDGMDQDDIDGHTDNMHKDD